MDGFGDIDLPAVFDDGQTLLQGGEATTRGAEIVAVLAVVAIEPACTDTQDEATVTDVVDSFRHI